MSVLIRLDGRKAFFRDGAWICADADLEARLNTFTEDWIRATGGPPIQERDPERVVALHVTRALGATVVRHVPSRGDRMRAYFLSRRQMELF